jgi:hypothetical protein
MAVDQRTHITNRWTGAAGSEVRIKRDPAKLLGSAVARSTPPLTACGWNTCRSLASKLSDESETQNGNPLRGRSSFTHPCICCLQLRACLASCQQLMLLRRGESMVLFMELHERTNTANYCGCLVETKSNLGQRRFLRSEWLSARAFRSALCYLRRRHSSGDTLRVAISQTSTVYRKLGQPISLRVHHPLFFRLLRSEGYTSPGHVTSSGG